MHLFDGWNICQKKEKSLTGKCYRVSSGTYTNISELRLRSENIQKCILETHFSRKVKKLISPQVYASTGALPKYHMDKISHVKYHTLNITRRISHAKYHT